MRTLVLFLVAALAALPSPARAQRANRSISVESGVSSPTRASGAPAVVLSAAASHWLEGDVHGTARLAWASAGETGDRAVAGAAGLAWLPGTARLRPRLFAEAGWAWVRRRAGVVQGAAALAAGAGLEWFFRRDAALTVAAALRGPNGSSIELLVGVRFGY